MISFTVTFESYTDMIFQILTTMSNCENAGWLFDMGHRVRCTAGHVRETEISIASVIIHESFCVFLLQIWTCIKMHMQLTVENCWPCAFICRTLFTFHIFGAIKQRMLINLYFMAKKYAAGSTARLQHASSCMRSVLLSVYKWTVAALITLAAWSKFNCQFVWNSWEQTVASARSALIWMGESSAIDWSSFKV